MRTASDVVVSQTLSPKGGIEWSETTLASDGDDVDGVNLDLDNDSDTPADLAITPVKQSVAFVRPRAPLSGSDPARPWPEGVPKNYEELYAQWGEYVSNLISRYNKVIRNFPDMVQWIWEKLLQSSLLEHYVDRLYNTRTTITNKEACEHMGMKWGKHGGAWGVRMWTAHYGKPVSKRGPCIGHDENGKKIYGPSKKVLNADGTRLRRKSGFMPRIIKGNYKNPLTLLVFDDLYELEILWERGVDERGRRLRHRAERAEAKLRVLVPVSTDANFAGYLRRAVRNHFCNFVRHVERKEKERLFDHFFTITNRLKEDEGSAWEELLVAEGSGEEAEIGIELHSKLNTIRRFVPEKYMKQLYEMLMDEMSLEQAINHLEGPTTDEKRSMSRAVTAIGGKSAQARKDDDVKNAQRTNARKERQVSEKKAGKTRAMSVPTALLLSPAVACFSKDKSEAVHIRFSEPGAWSVSHKGTKATIEFTGVTSSDEAYISATRLSDNFRLLGRHVIRASEKGLCLDLDLKTAKVAFKTEMVQTKTAATSDCWELRVQAISL